MAAGGAGPWAWGLRCGTNHEHQEHNGHRGEAGVGGGCDERAEEEELHVSLWGNVGLKKRMRPRIIYVHPGITKRQNLTVRTAAADDRSGGATPSSSRTQLRVKRYEYG